MLFKNSQFQKENFLGYKLRDFMIKEYEHYSTIMLMSAKETFEDKENITDEELNDVALTLINQARNSIVDDVANFIEKTYKTKGNYFIQLAYEVIEENKHKEFRLDADEIKEYGFSSHDIYNLAINTIFPDINFAWTLGHETQFLETISQLMLEIWKYEITRFSAVFAYFIRENKIKDFPSYLNHMAVSCNADIDKLLED